jgi:hypothetical protein
LNKITVIPPQIIQRFSELLLHIQSPKFGDDADDIINILHYLREILWKKLDKCPAKKKKCEKLYKEIFEMYESIKTEKENCETKTAFTAELPFCYFKCARGSCDNILQRCKYKARAFAYKSSSDSIPQVQE